MIAIKILARITRMTRFLLCGGWEARMRAVEKGLNPINALRPLSTALDDASASAALRLRASGD